jgi:N-acetylneuraminic acid mutarotase
MPIPRKGVAVAAAGGKIYAIGGYDTYFQTYVHEYDPTADVWISRTAIPRNRNGMVAVALNGKIYAIGGSDGTYKKWIDVYDPGSNTWTPKADMNNARGWPAAAVCNGKIYVIGGYDGNSGIYLDSIEEYNPLADSWTVKTAMPTQRASLTAQTVGGKIFAIGGERYSQHKSTVEAYDPASNAWTIKADMPTARHGLGSAVFDGKILAIGGYNSVLNNLATVEEYDPASDSWTERRPILQARRELGVATLFAKVFTFGGNISPTEWGNSPVGTVERIDLSVQTALTAYRTAELNGQVLNVVLTVTYTGETSLSQGTPVININAGAQILEFLNGPTPAAVSLNPGEAQSFTWKYRMLSGGTVRFTASPTGTETSISDSSWSSGEASLTVTTGEIMSGNPPASGKIQVRNNVLRIGRNATAYIVVRAPSGPGEVTLTLYSQAGVPLGRIGNGPVAVGADGSGYTAFDGRVGGKALSTGKYWVVATGAVKSREQIMVINDGK